ncbi:hypothetical protein IAQ61_004908 [Plenodomus lingam]|uniref:uncharacterized protein n=1 Tax=Leptosphaeria maculans TaxID=5022 RepID=UPI0033184922|nr:hypothetical protein IAQ61_004908 [Plenodomus lingam]
MCGFTLVHCLACGSKELSIVAKDTRLCNMATLLNNLDQGIDCAPAACSPTSEEETIIFATKQRVGPCNNCRPATVPDAREELDEVLQRHAHPQEIGTYGTNEVSQLQDLVKFLEARIADGKELANACEEFLNRTPEALAHIQDPIFRQTLSRPGPEKYQAFYLNALEQCGDMLPILAMYIRKRVPNKLFVDTCEYTADQAKVASVLMDHFHLIFQCIEGFMPSNPSENFNGSEARLALSIELLSGMLLNTGTSYPPGHLLQPNFVLASGTGQRFAAVEKERQAFISLPTPRLVRPAEKQPGRLNRSKLAVMIHAGVLDEEPASDIKIVHVPFPEGGKTNVQDTAGNQLIFQADGTSTLIWAVDSSMPPVEKEQSPKRSLPTSSPLSCADKPSPLKQGVLSGTTITTVSYQPDSIPAEEPKIPEKLNASLSSLAKKRKRSASPKQFGITYGLDYSDTISEPSDEDLEPPPHPARTLTSVVEDKQTELATLPVSSSSPQHTEVGTQKNSSVEKVVPSPRRPGTASPTAPIISQLSPQSTVLIPSSPPGSPSPTDVIDKTAVVPETPLPVPPSPTPSAAPSSPLPAPAPSISAHNAPPPLSRRSTRIRKPPVRYGQDEFAGLLPARKRTKR